MLTNREATKQFKDSYTSTRCNRMGNGVAVSKSNRFNRRKLNKLRRRITKKITEED